MSVRSVPLKEGQPIARRSLNSGEIAAGVALLVFGVMLWLAGARYTLEGWVFGLNWFLTWLGLPLHIPPIIGAWMLLAIPVGLVYSLVELFRPWRSRGSASNTALIWIIWFVIVITDGGSTFLGVKAPAPDAWLLTRQVAASDYLAGAWSLILTFVPEWFMLGAWRLLRR